MIISTFRIHHSTFCGEFANCLTWWRHNSDKNERAWRVPVARFIVNGYNLNIKYPNAKVDFEHLPPERLVKNNVRKEQRGKAKAGYGEYMLKDLAERLAREFG